MVNGELTSTNQPPRRIKVFDTYSVKRGLAPKSLNFGPTDLQFIYESI